MENKLTRLEVEHDFISDDTSTHYNCMDCEWSGDISECHMDTEPNDMSGGENVFMVCPECGGGLDR